MTKHTEACKKRRYGKAIRSSNVISLIIFITLVFAPSIYLVGCGTHIGADALVCAALKECHGHPAGILYSTAANDDAPERLTNDMLAKLFGSGSDLPAVLENINSAAIFLPTRGAAFEIAVIETVSSADALETAALCFDRIDTIIELFDKSNGTDSAVWIYGRYVISALCPNAERVIRTATALL